MRWKELIITCREDHIQEMVEAIIATDNDDLIIRSLMTLKKDEHLLTTQTDFNWAPEKLRDKKKNRIKWSTSREIIILNEDVREDVDLITNADRPLGDVHKDVFDQLNEYIYKKDIVVVTSLIDHLQNVYEDLVLRIV